MPLLKINATPDGLALHDTPHPASRRLYDLASASGPAIIMVHGYKYKPGAQHHCPHAKIFGNAADNWPAQLQFGTDTPDEGLGIALGWDARGTLHKVHRRAMDTGKGLATIVKLLRRHAPHRPVHIVAHSLGAELALSALAHLPRGAINRMVLLTGASYYRRAVELLETPAGRSVEVLNITSRENDLFDAAFERMVPAPAPGDRAIGQGITARNVTNVQLDCPHTLLGFSRMGFEVAGPTRRICHWSAYTRPGVMAFYNAFLRDPAMLPQARIAQWLPLEPAPRWSRLWPALSMRTHTGHMPDAMPDLGLSVAPQSLGSNMSYRDRLLTERHKNEPAY